MDKKIAFFDVDGTIVTDRAQGGEKIVPESTVRAIKRAREKGNLCFINSGRPYCNIDKDILDIGFDGVISGCGTNILIGGKEILHVTNPKNVCRETLEACRACRINGFFEGRDKNYFSQNGPDIEWIVEFIELTAKNGAVTSTDTNGEDFAFDKMCALYDEESDTEKFVNTVSRYFSVIDRTSFYELVPKECSKGAAMEIVLDYYTIPRENSYAFGDSMNDIDMFRATPNSIGMGNGKAVHPYVSFVTRDILDDGIEYAMKRFGLTD